VSAQQSAIALFTAGILPSLLIGAVDALYVMLYARVKPSAADRACPLDTNLSSTKEASWSIGTIVVISAASTAACSADRGRRRRGDLFAVRDHGGAPRGRFSRSLAYHPERGVLISQI